GGALGAFLAFIAAVIAIIYVSRAERRSRQEFAAWETRWRDLTARIYALEQALGGEARAVIEAEQRTAAAEPAAAPPVTPAAPGPPRSRRNLRRRLRLKVALPLRRRHRPRQAKRRRCPSPRLVSNQRIRKSRSTLRKRWARTG